MRFLSRFLLSVLPIIMCAQTVYAGTWFYKTQVSNLVANKWYKGGVENGTPAGDFILSGTAGRGRRVGWLNDEYGVGAVVAVDIDEHGARFCPRSLHCNNKNKRNWSDLYVMYSEGHKNRDETSCVWLCEKGYFGANCKRGVREYRADDTLLHPKKEGGLWGGTDVIQDKNYSGHYHGLPVFWTYEKYGDEASTIFLGVVKFLDHGVFVAPVRLDCHSEDGSDNNSWPSDIFIPNGEKTKLLCMDGYTPNAKGDDCVPLTADFIAQDEFLKKNNITEYCDGWDSAEFNLAYHQLAIDEDNKCVKFLCKDSTKAFPARGNYACEECGTNIRGGQSRETGLCVQCDRVGQYFDKDTGKCALADAFTTTDLQYGRGKTVNSAGSLTTQCWTKVIPSEYIDCVTKTTASTSQGQITTQIGGVGTDSNTDSGNSGNTSSSGDSGNTSSSDNSGKTSGSGNGGDTTFTGGTDFKGGGLEVEYGRL